MSAMDPTMSGKTETAQDRKLVRFIQDRRMIFLAAAEIMSNLGDKRGVSVGPDVSVANAILLWNEFDTMTAQYADDLVGSGDPQ